MTDLDVVSAHFASAAASFIDLVRVVPEDRWDGPGLEAWDLRSLIGHTSRSLTTVDDYLDTSPEREDVLSPAEYYQRAAAVMAADETAVLERGRQAGQDLGADPLATIEALTASVTDKLTRCDDRLIAVLGGLGIRLSQYLPTRTFELIVHGYDIAAATGVGFAPDDHVLQGALELATQIAVATGQGPAALNALTGRQALPVGFSIV